MTNDKTDQPDIEIDFNPNLIKLMLEMSELNTLTDDTDIFIYHVVKSIIYHQSVRQDVYLPFYVFGYYVEVHKLYLDNHPELKMDKISSVEQALLSIFDLYRIDPKNTIVNKMLQLSLKSLHEIIIKRLSNTVDDPRKIIDPGANIALISQTIKDFTKERNRLLNLRYIEWIRQTFKTIIEDPKIETLNDVFTSPLGKSTIDQLTTGKKVISIKD